MSAENGITWVVEGYPPRVNYDWMALPMEPSDEPTLDILAFAVTGAYHACRAACDPADIPGHDPFDRERAGVADLGD